MLPGRDEADQKLDHDHKSSHGHEDRPLVPLARKQQARHVLLLACACLEP